MPTYGDLSERQDNEIAQEIQEELVRQAEQQRQQEEKDAVWNTHTHTHTHTHTRFCPFKHNVSYSHPSVGDL